MLIALTGCAVTPSAVTAQRPTFSSDTATTAAGTFELEAGVGIDPRDSFDSPLSIKYGLSQTSEVFVGGSPYQWLETPGSDGRGAGDTLVGTRHRFFEETEEGRPSAAVQLVTKIPTGSEREGLSTGELDFFASGIVTKHLSRLVVTGFYQLGFLGEPNDRDFDLEHGLAFAAATPAFGNTSVFGELATIIAPEEDREELFTTMGMSYAMNDSFVFDAAVVVGLSRDAPDFQILLGFTRNLGEFASWFGSSDDP